MLWFCFMLLNVIDTSKKGCLFTNTSLPLLSYQTLKISAHTKLVSVTQSRCIDVCYWVHDSSYWNFLFLFTVGATEWKLNKIFAMAHSPDKLSVGFQ